MFFTLSGFLITSLLLEERTRTGRYSIPAFYRRRALRLFPALVVCVTAAVVIELVVRQRIDSPSMVIGALTYTSNFVMLDGDWGSSLLTHTWSLGIEEQFYLLWPLLLGVLVTMTRWVALTTMLLLALVSVLWQLDVSDAMARFGHAYLGLDARAYMLLLGCALAFALHRSADRRVPSTLGLLPIAVIIWVPLGHGSLVVEWTTPLLVVVMLYAATHSPPSLLGSKPLAWVGERTYGIYLYHALVLYVVRTVAPDLSWRALLPIISAISVAAAALSFKYVEEPFLNKRHSRGAEVDTRHPRGSDVQRCEPSLSQS